MAREADHPDPASLPELEVLSKALPDRYRLMALLAAWCALRFGELAKLRRGDVDVKNAVIHVRRSVVRPRGTAGRRAVKGPKSDAGRRDVHVPPHLLPTVKDHLREHRAGRCEPVGAPAARAPGRRAGPAARPEVWQIDEQPSPRPSDPARLVPVPCATRAPGAGPETYRSEYEGTYSITASAVSQRRR